MLKMDSVLILKVGIGGIELSKRTLAGGFIAFLGILSAFSHFSRKDAENIGVKLKSGYNATVFTLPDGDTLKIVRLDNENNKKQAIFINDYIQKTKSGEWKVCKALPTYYYFNAGFGNTELQEQMEEENVVYEHIVKYNQPFAMWVTPTYKTEMVSNLKISFTNLPRALKIYSGVIKQELSTKIQNALDELSDWGKEYDVEFFDLHKENCGLDDEGNIIFYDFFADAV